MDPHSGKLQVASLQSAPHLVKHPAEQSIF